MGRNSLSQLHVYPFYHSWLTVAGIGGHLGWGEGSFQQGTRRPHLFCVSGAVVMESKEERLWGWASQLLRKFWLGWFLVSDDPKMQNHEQQGI